MQKSWFNQVKTKLHDNNLKFIVGGADLYYLLNRAGNKCYLTNFNKMNFISILQQDHTLALKHTYDYINSHLRNFGFFDLVIDNQLLNALEQKAITDNVRNNSYRVILLDARQDALDNYDLSDPKKALQIAHTAILFVNNRSEYFFLLPCTFNIANYSEINNDHLPIIKTTVKQIQDLAKPLLIQYQNCYFVNSSSSLQVYQILTYLGFDNERVRAIYNDVKHPYAILANLCPIKNNVTFKDIAKFKQQEMLKTLTRSI